MNDSTRILALCLASVVFVACDMGKAPGPPPKTGGDALKLPAPETSAADHPNFESYWYQGLAELSRYKLTQSRYGAPRDGEAVLIFVTEDFLPDVQVKHEQGERPDAVSVLKLNAYRRFYTGIYPYTALTSSFTPAREKNQSALKASTSVQEWCGHAYTQLNRRNGKLEAKTHSYFQNEGDKEETLDDVLLEDGLWARLRRDPGSLPQGNIKLIPALHHVRFTHIPLQSEVADASITTTKNTKFSPNELKRYTVRYAAIGRTLHIYFAPKFPHAILGWEEIQSRSGATETTRAIRTHAILDDYWKHNRPEDGAYRDALGLTL